MLDYGLSEEQLAVRDIARTIAENELRPVAAEYDATARHIDGKPRERPTMYSAMAKLFAFRRGGAGDDRRAALSLTVPWNKRSKKLLGVRTGVSFHVDDLKKTYTPLKKKKVKFHLAPRRERWGGRVANFEDPDGNQFFLLQMPSDFRK